MSTPTPHAPVGEHAYNLLVAYVNATSRRPPVELATETVEIVPLLRQSLFMTAVYCAVYGAVCLAGFVGNAFVIAAVLCDTSMRTVTNLFIVSLAAADLLIVLLSLPATLMNNVLTEWHIGGAMCKTSIWVQAATTGASVYTLVAVTADRYVAICHSMHYHRAQRSTALVIIALAWLLSAILFSPWAMYSRCYEHVVNGRTGLTATICRPVFSSLAVERALFVSVNIFAAFLLPLAAITVLYVRIFKQIYGHATATVVAVDRAAGAREQRMRFRAAVMMLSVIAVFVMCWAPLYTLYFYFYFVFDAATAGSTVATDTLRPVFQWLSLANSCINPLIYATFSSTFRSAFQRICYRPFTAKYHSVRTYTIRKLSRKSRTDNSIRSTTGRHERANVLSSTGCGVHSMKTRRSLYGSNGVDSLARNKYGSERQLTRRCKSGMDLHNRHHVLVHCHGKEVTVEQRAEVNGTGSGGGAAHGHRMQLRHLRPASDSEFKGHKLSLIREAAGGGNTAAASERPKRRRRPKVAAESVPNGASTPDSPVFCSDTPPAYSPPPPPPAASAAVPPMADC